MNLYWKKKVNLRDGDCALNGNCSKIRMVRTQLKIYFLIIRFSVFRDYITNSLTIYVSIEHSKTTALC